MNNDINNNGELDNDVIFSDLLNVISIMIGLQNLEENRQQSKANNVGKHNEIQEKHILSDIHQKFDEQNQLLFYQNNLLEEILKILKGGNKNGL